MFPRTSSPRIVSNLGLKSLMKCVHSASSCRGQDYIYFFKIQWRTRRRSFLLLNVRILWSVLCKNIYTQYTFRRKWYGKKNPIIWSYRIMIMWSYHIKTSVIFSQFVRRIVGFSFAKKTIIRNLGVLESFFIQYLQKQYLTAKKCKNDWEFFFLTDSYNK